MIGDPVSAFEAMGEWGYCRYCDRLELLTDEGKLEEHGPAFSSYSVESGYKGCMGQGRTPTEPPAEREQYGPQPLTPDPVHPTGG